MNVLVLIEIRGRSTKPDIPQCSLQLIGCQMPFGGYFLLWKERERGNRWQKNI